MTSAVRFPQEFTASRAPRERAIELATRFVQIEARLRSMPDLAPSPTVDAAFSELVDLCSYVRGDVAEAVLEALERENLATSLRRLCSLGECALEHAWVERILAQPGDTWEALRDFPYFENYVELTRLEFSVVQSFAAEPVQRALFLGSGPLALTNIVLAKYHNVLARGIDHDAPAVALSNRLSERLGIAGQVSAKHRRAESLEAKQIRAADVVYLAAMVGEDRPEKAEVLKHLHTSMQPGQLLVVRSAHRLRRLLYPAIDVDDIGGFEPLAEIHPHNDIVNSFLVLRRS